MKKIQTDSKKKEKIIVKAKETDGEKAKFDCPKCDERLECESKWRHHISNSHGNKKKLMTVFRDCFEFDPFKKKVSVLDVLPYS